MARKNHRGDRFYQRLYTLKVNGIPFKYTIMRRHYGDPRAGTQTVYTWVSVLDGDGLNWIGTGDPWPVKHVPAAELRETILCLLADGRMKYPAGAQT